MKKLAALFAVIAVCAMTFTSALVSGRNSSGENLFAPASRSVIFPPGARFVPQQVLVQFKPGAVESERFAAQRLVGAALIERIETAPMRAAGDGELLLVAVSSELSVAEAIRSLEHHPAVLFAEPNWIYEHQAISNDPFYTNGSMWGMYGDLTTPANAFGSQAGEAWAAGFTGSSTVYVGVIDEGVQFAHPDLSANMWVNSFDGVDGIDNDGNGYVDDLRGWDFYNDDNTIYDGGTSGNLDDHGTHVAGTIGAVGGNGIGVIGVNWNVRLISGKFLGADGGTTADAVRAIDYFTDLKTRHRLNIVATNNSWGGGGFSQAMLDAITRAANANILFFAAAGNGGSDFVGDDNDSTPHYPSNYNTTAGAGYDNVIAVASINSSGAKASSSNFGATSVDLGAPGVGIFSTLPFNRYGSYSGTSMATPHVAGAAALYSSINPGSSALTIRNALLNSIIPTASLNGRTVTGGRLNVGNFSVTPTPTPPVGLQYYALPHPVRLLDTRAGQLACDAPGAPLVGGAHRTQGARVTCGGVTIPASAQAIVGNATAVNNTGAAGGFVTLYPNGAALPVVSHLNYSFGEVVPNSFTVGLGADGAFNIYATSGINFIVDVTGYYAPPNTGGLYYHPLPQPVRLLDTRAAQPACDAPGAPLIGGTSRTQLARTTCNGASIPADALAIVGNATAVNTTPGAATGFITLYPESAARPTASNLNYVANQIVPNSFTVGLGASGAFDIYASSATHFIVDVAGYYSTQQTDVNGTGLLYFPLSAPVRLLDTRAGQPACDAPGVPLIGGTSRTELARTTCGGQTIPASAQAIIGNATAVNNTGAAGGFVTLYRSGASLPTASNLNYASGQTVPNSFVVGLGATDGTFQIYAQTSINLIVDLTGYFAP